MSRCDCRFCSEMCSLGGEVIGVEVVALSSMEESSGHEE